MLDKKQQISSAPNMAKSQLSSWNVMLGMKVTLKVQNLYRTKHFYSGKLTYNELSSAVHIPFGINFGSLVIFHFRCI